MYLIRTTTSVVLNPSGGYSSQAPFIKKGGTFFVILSSKHYNMSLNLTKVKTNEAKAIVQRFERLYNFHLIFLELYDNNSIRVRIKVNNYDDLPDFLDKKKSELSLYKNGTPKPWTLEDNRRWPGMPRCVHRVIYNNEFFEIIRPSFAAEFDKNEGVEIDYNFKNYTDEEFVNFFKGVDLILSFKFIKSLI